MRNTIKEIGFRFGLVCVCCESAHMLWMKRGDGIVIESGWWHSRRESGKERAWRRERKGKEGEKWFEGKERLFAFV
mgnify:CR=1 FL=1